MAIGIEQFHIRRDLWLDRILVQPLRSPASDGAPMLRLRSMLPIRGRMTIPAQTGHSVDVPMLRCSPSKRSLLHCTAFF
jgi:hypothetical protein